MLDYKEFLPKELKKGYTGFYPCKTNEWDKMPLPMKCATWFDNVEYVIFDVYLSDFKISSKIEIHRDNAFKALFCISEKDPTLYSVIGVRFADGKKTFAKWYQDTKSGSYSITGINGHVYGVQGGYKCHIPKNCYKDNNNDWKLEYVSNDKEIYSSCLV